MLRFFITIAVIAGAAAISIALTYRPYHREMKAAKARLLACGTILKTDHGDVEYAIEGEGTPVLSLHGAGGGYDQGLWAAKMAFGDGHKLISVSRYGYLRTPIPQNASIKAQAALYRDLLDHLRIPKVIVLGTSAGGPSATQFANDYPERTSALILISAVSEASVTGDKPAFYVGIIHLIQRSDYAYWLVAKFGQRMILDLMGIPADVYARFTPAQKQLAQGMLDTMHPMSQRYQGTVNDGDMIQREAVSTDNVSVPTLVLHAKDDALVSYHHAEHAHEAIKRSRLISFDTGGHGLLPQMNAVRQAVKEFLELP
ncbi:MAG TPA: alpha/beta hydrolase [Bryobacteraceae bacterium]|nr:alpha/beta hydrolase [Bryobacteraceae bacterium]